MLYLAAIALLLLTVPLFGGAPLAGLPAWVWGSLGATLAFAFVIVMIIEKKWDAIKNEERLDG